MIDRDTAHSIAVRNLGGSPLVSLGEPEELREGWYFPYQCREDVVGSNGLIVNKQTGAVFHLGSAFPVKRDLTFYDAGFQCRAYDLVVLAVHDMDTALDMLEQLRLSSLVVPEYEHGRVWRIPRCVSRADLQAKLRSLPCVFGEQDLYFKLERLVELRESGCCEFRAVPLVSTAEPAAREPQALGNRAATDDDARQVECFWRLQIDARTEPKAERVLARVFERLAVPTHGLRMGRHPDQYYSAYFLTRHEGTWAEQVVDVLGVAMRVAYSPYYMTLDEACLDMWAGKSAIAGCVGVQVLLPPP